MDPAKDDSSVPNIQSLPRDAVDIKRILSSLHIDSYEPRVINQILEYAYKEVHEVINRSKIFANHCSRDNILPSDIELAISTNNCFTSLNNSTLNNFPSLPLNRIHLSQISTEINSHPIPPLPERFGVLLPPQSYCITNPNYDIKLN